MLEKEDVDQIRDCFNNELSGFGSLIFDVTNPTEIYSIFEKPAKNKNSFVAMLEEAKLVQFIRVDHVIIQTFKTIALQDDLPGTYIEADAFIDKFDEYYVRFIE